MTSVPGSSATPPRELNAQLLFQKRLQELTNRIHAAATVDEIMLEGSAEVCALFNADQVVIYGVAEDGRSLASKVRSGPDSFRDLKLPIGEDSIPGYAALARKTVHIGDVYDDEELKAVNPNIRFVQEVDRRAGYRTRQMLVAPIVDVQNQELVGVIQLINNRSGLPFDARIQEGVTELAQTLAIALRQRQKAQKARTKYDFLIREAVLSPREFELASRQARERAIHIEQVLVEEFGVGVSAIGRSAAKFFGVRYEPFRPDRIKLPDLLKNLKREYVETNQWLPIDDTKEGVVVMCLDPEQIRSSRIVPNVFPNAKIVYRVTTQKEFNDTIDQSYGATPEALKPGVAYARGTLERLIAQVVNEAYRSGNRERLVQETADLWRYSLIMLRRHDLELQDVLAELRRRETVDKVERAAAAPDDDTEAH